jgi:SAM-dependent methyltransferase
VPDHSEQLARIARGWDEAADGYEAYFVPRFAPWTKAAVAAIIAPDLPEGTVLVPCCGTFPELDTLLAYLPDREIVGIDLSAGMVRLARQRAARWPKVDALVGDASALDDRWSGRCAAVVSVFGLQQLPEPDLAVRSWLAALRPGGRLSIMYWPEVTEADGPFALMRTVVRAHVPAGDYSWEDRLVEALTGQGAAVERDEQVSYPMSHPDARAFVDAYCDSGPLRALALARPARFVDELREEVLRHAPAGEWNHRPHARLIVARRPVSGR